MNSGTAEMVKAGWRVKDSKNILDGAGYVLAPWLENVLAPWLEKEINNIREIKSCTEGTDTGFWM